MSVTMYARGLPPVVVTVPVDVCLKIARCEQPEPGVNRLRDASLKTLASPVKAPTLIQADLTGCQHTSSKVSDPDDISTQTSTLLLWV
jgi:hypothetical protein